MKFRVLIAAICISLTSAVAFAHGGEEHVIGTATKVTPDSITVKTTANKIVVVAVSSESKLIQNKAAAKISDLNVGSRVVIHAKEPTEGHLVADTVEFAASQPTQAGLAATQSKEQTFTGVISDASCGAMHNMKGMSAADCARMCIKAGEKPVLVVGKNIYTLQGHEAEFLKLAGATATVKGSLNGKTLTVASVTGAAKG